MVEKPVSVTVAVALTGARATPSAARATSTPTAAGSTTTSGSISVPSSRLRTPRAARPTGSGSLRPTDQASSTSAATSAPPAEGGVRDAEPGRVDVDDGLAGGVAGELLLEAGRGGVARQAGDVHAGDGHAGVDPVRVLALVGEQGAGAEPEREHEPGDHAEDELPEREGAGGRWRGRGRRHGPGESTSIARVGRGTGPPA